MPGPKNKSTNSKAEAAMEKKALAEKKKEKERAAEEEKKTAAEWSVGSNARAAGRAAVDAEKQAEKFRQEMEKKKALAEDEAATAGVPKPKKKGKKKGDDVSALLMAGLSSKEAKQKKGPVVAKKDPAVEEAKAKAKEEAERKARAKGIVMNHQDDLMVENVNRRNDEEESATGIDGAISLLSVTGGGGAGKPESKNLKALYAAFEEKTIAQLKTEQPGLKLSQYKDRCFALWSKSPENPKNQLGGAQK